MYHVIDLPTKAKLLGKLVEKTNLELVSVLEKTNLSDDLVNLYRTFNKFQIRWVIEGDLETTGEVRITSAQDFVSQSGIQLDTPQISWFIDGKEISLKGVFIPLDYNDEQSCVGVFTEYWDSGKLFYYEFGSTFYSLNIGVRAYFQLLKYTYGTSYWPRILLTEKEAIFKNSLSDLILQITEINPIFKFDEFMKLYYSLVEVDLESNQDGNGR